MVPASSHTHVFDLDGRNVLFHELSTRLFVLNPSASLVWEYLSEGYEPDPIVAKLCEHTGAPRGQVSRDVGALLDQWRACGLINSEQPLSLECGPQNSCDEDSIGDAPKVRNGRPKFSGERTYSRTFQLVDYPFCVQGDIDLAAISDELLGHLTISDSHEGEDWPLFELYYWKHS